jgi:hypothetical protein
MHKSLSAVIPAGLEDKRAPMPLNAVRQAQALQTARLQIQEGRRSARPVRGRSCAAAGELQA